MCWLSEAAGLCPCVLCWGVCDGSLDSSQLLAANVGDAEGRPASSGIRETGVK